MERVVYFTVELAMVVSVWVSRTQRCENKRTVPILVVYYIG